MAKYAVLFQKYILLFFLVELVRADDLECPNNYNSTTTMRRLKGKVFCSYDSVIRPVRQQNETVDVKLRLVLKKIEFDEIRDTVKVHDLLIMSWTDYHFLWDPAQYDNIQDLRIFSYRLWTPDIGVFTSADQTAFSPYMHATICVVFYDGNVWCIPPFTHTATCSADLTYWPYDKHTCKLVMGSWSHTGERVNISLMDQSIYFHDYNMNREWELTSLTSYRESGKFSCCPNDTFPSVTFKMVLQRHSGSYTAIVVTPAVVLMLITLVTFWMKHDQSNRLILATIDMFCHFLYLQYLGNILPSNGASSPLIVTFYRDSMFLATLAVLTIIIVRGLRRTSIAPPAWISSLSSWVLQNRFGQVLVFHNLDPKGAAAVSEASGGESTVLVDDPSATSSGWNTFTFLLDVTCFTVTLFTYFILLFKFIP